MSRRPSVSIYNYPEALNPFNDEPVTNGGCAAGHTNGEAKTHAKEPKHKFWTFGRSKKKQRSNSFSIKSTWSGLFGKRKDAQEVEIRKPAIATVSSTYKRGTYDGYPVAPARLSTDQQEFDEALGTLARRRKYTLDNSSRYGSSLTVNGDPGRIYEGTPQDTTTSIMGDLTPKPPARRFGQISPKPTDKLPPLEFNGRERTSNGSVVLEASGPDGTPVPPKRGGRRASQRSIAATPFEDEDASRSGDVTLRDENENVPDDFVFKRISRDAIRQSNLSINSCVSVGSTVSAYGRKKRRAPDPPRLKERLEAPKEVDVRPSSVEPSAAPQTVDPIDIARVTENIDEMTKRTGELIISASPPPSPTTKSSENPREDVEPQTEKIPEVSTSVASVSTDEIPTESTPKSPRKIPKPRRTSKEEPFKETPEDPSKTDKKSPEEEKKEVEDEEENSPASGSKNSSSPKNSSAQIETETEVEVEVELRRKPSRDNIEIIPEIRDHLEKDAETAPLARHESCGNLSRSDSFSVKEVIDNIERKIKYLEAKNARDASAEETNEIFERCGARKSLRDNRRQFFRNMTTDESGVRVEVSELPREQTEIRLVRLEDPPIAAPGPTEPVKVIELHISEPIRRTPVAIVADRDVNPIPKPRRHSNLSLERRDRRRDDDGGDDDGENEKRGNSL